MLKNVVNNGLKFTERGSVVVTCRRQTGHIELAVRDTGPGIPADQIARIFEPFQQADLPGRRQKGAGLGLHIVRRLLDLLGGEIAVESTVGSGSTFRIRLPIERA